MSLRRRREERVSIALPIRVWGMDAYGRPFTQSATTMDVSREGARIKDLGCELSPGEIVGIQHGNEKARFRVSWVSVARSLQAPGQLGVHCIEPGRCIWDREIRQVTQRIPPPAQERPRAQFGADPAATAQASAPLSSLLVPMAADVQPAMQTYACKGTAEVHVLQTGTQQRATLTRLSSVGCYVETFSPLPVNTAVELLLRTVDLELRCTAAVRTCDAHFGMGLNFNRMSPEATARLGMILQRLSPAATSTSRRAAEATSGAAPDSQSGPMSTAAQAAAATISPSTRDMAARCGGLVASLSELETFLRTVQTGVDPRVLTEFRASLEHARHTTAIVQQWLELRSQNRDPFPAVTAMQEHRIHNANLLICDLLDELEGSVKLPATRGMDRLIENLRQFGRHLARIAGDQKD